ncbi:MAG: helix-turn-helix transcriptional regulator [Alphaproteobacteria bacterium]|nr:helix-turn-helix transcriptional regulator [Alphaproteobacteria bacterium]
MTHQLSFGGLLKQWRVVRRTSQLDLAEDAEVSPRHVSFLETGRARPSREMVLVLASALEVPLRERNVLLAAAGFSPAYTEGDLDGQAMAAVRRALDWTLRQAEPFPAVALNRRWDVVTTNRAAGALFGLLLGDRAPTGPVNVLRMMLDPDGLRPLVSNWRTLVPELLRRIRREAVERVLDAETEALLDEVMPWVPPELRGHDVTVPSVPVIPVHFRKGDLDLRFFSTVTVLGTPQDVTAQELRVEVFFPEDAHTEAEARRRFSGRSDDTSPAE